MLYPYYPLLKTSAPLIFEALQGYYVQSWAKTKMWTKMIPFSLLKPKRELK